MADQHQADRKDLSADEWLVLVAYRRLDFRNRLWVRLLVNALAAGATPIEEHHDAEVIPLYRGIPDSSKR